MRIALCQYSVKQNDTCVLDFLGTKPDTYETLMLQHLPLNSQVYECAVLCTNNCIDLIMSAQKETNIMIIC